jgi:succinyl-CoA synthetase beta subunit
VITNLKDFHMNIHEHQAKVILQRHGIPVPPFVVIDKLEEVNAALDALKAEKVVLKVQVHAGGRGKAGGIKIANTPAEVVARAKELLGMRIINAQTGNEGVVANSVMITPCVDFKKEYYLAAIIDRHRAEAILIASPEGGMDIEEIAATSPDKIATFPIGAGGKIRGYHLIQLAKFMGWQGKQIQEGKHIAEALAKAFMASDGSLLEINPLVETLNGSLVALDAKFSIDENGLFRQKDIAGYYDPSQSPAREAEAKSFDLAYIALDGNIGCMVNGAGLAMATMDLIKIHGGTPANFLDVGGGASEEKIAEGFRIILQDPQVKAIFVNIFGGIMNCATLASGIIAAAANHKIQVPLVVRMEGTNVEQGKALLKNSGLQISIADTLESGAELAVQAAKRP